jgi:hypothetical protein
MPNKTFLFSILLSFLLLVASYESYAKESFYDIPRTEFLMQWNGHDIFSDYYNEAIDQHAGSVVYTNNMAGVFVCNVDKRGLLGFPTGDLIGVDNSVMENIPVAFSFVALETVIKVVIDVDAKLLKRAGVDPEMCQTFRNGFEQVQLMNDIWSLYSAANDMTDFEDQWEKAEESKKEKLKEEKTREELIIVGEMLAALDSCKASSRYNEAEVNRLRNPYLILIKSLYGERFDEPLIDEAYRAKIGRYSVVMGFDKLAICNQVISQTKSFINLANAY